MPHFGLALKRALGTAARGRARVLPNIAEAQPAPATATNTNESVRFVVAK